VLPENHWCVAVTQSQYHGKGAPGKGNALSSILTEHRCHMNPGTHCIATLEMFKQLNFYDRWKIPEENIVIKKIKSLKNPS